MMGLLHAGAIEVNVVGDFEGAELEEHVLRYLGTVPPRDPSQVGLATAGRCQMRHILIPHTR